MPLHVITFDLNEKCVVSCNVLDGHFTSGTYTNQYPFPLNFQVVDTAPRRGEKFFYTFKLMANVVDEPLPALPGINVEGLYAKIALARN
jgi:hypothetical protein